MRTFAGGLIIAVAFFATAATFQFPEVRTWIGSQTGLSPLKVGVPVAGIATVIVIAAMGICLRNKPEGSR